MSIVQLLQPVARVEKVKKKAAQRVHANRRAVERFGCEPSPGFYRELVSDIQAGRLQFKGRITNRLTMWGAEFVGQPVVVIYDNGRKSITTLLTPEMAERKQTKQTPSPKD